MKEWILGLMRRLFDWYAKEDCPFSCYPSGWGWLKPKAWRTVKNLRAIIRYGWEHGGEERLRQAMRQFAMRQFVLYGEGVVVYDRRKPS